MSRLPRPAAASPEALDHYESPRNPGVFPRGTPGVGRGEAGCAGTGDLVRLQVRLVGRRVAEARFQAFGCLWTIAAASLATERVSGLATTSALALDARDLARELRFPAAEQARAALAIQALRGAIGDAMSEESMPGR